MQLITQRDLQDNFAAVLAAVEAGQIYRVTRDGETVAELRPLPRRQGLTAEDLVARHGRLPRVDYSRMRQEADEFFESD